MEKLKKRMKSIIKQNFYLSILIYKIREFFLSLHSDEYLVKKKYKKVFSKPLNLENPQTLNEKIQWLKLNIHEDFHTVCADKYRVREYYAKNFGTEYLIPLILKTCNWKDITPEKLPDYPFVIKCNNGSGMVIIVHDKKTADWKKIREQCRFWLKSNPYQFTQEWQYKNVEPCIIVEKLLLTKEGKLPNDYKLNYINGKLEFIYCSVDREGGNYRNIYDAQWNLLDFSWVAKRDHRKDLIGKNIKKPETFDKMVEIGNEIAKRFQLVRVDFFDVDGKLYYGEITLHHGSGFDTFEPEKYDLEYGKKLKLK